MGVIFVINNFNFLGDRRHCQFTLQKRLLLHVELLLLLHPELSKTQLDPAIYIVGVTTFFSLSTHIYIYIDHPYTCLVVLLARIFVTVFERKFPSRYTSIEIIHFGHFTMAVCYIVFWKPSLTQI